MDVFFSTFVVFLIVLDPIGNTPIFMALTHNMEAGYRRTMAIRGVSLATAILLVFMLVFLLIGDTLLAIDMVFARQSGLRSTTVQEQHEAEHKHDVSVFPLAFPLIAGPGALTTVLLMTSPRPALLVFVGMLVTLLLVLALTLTSLLFADRIMRLLGETGANVITRLMGVILTALAVQYVLDGIKAAGLL